MTDLATAPVVVQIDRPIDRAELERVVVYVMKDVRWWEQPRWVDDAYGFFRGSYGARDQITIVVKRLPNAARVEVFGSSPQQHVADVERALADLSIDVRGAGWRLRKVPEPAKRFRHERERRERTAVVVARGTIARSSQDHPHTTLFRLADALRLEFGAPCALEREGEQIVARVYLLCRRRISDFYTLAGVSHF